MAWLFAPIYDRILTAAEAASFGPWRRELFRDLHGTVLEIGAGTGASIPHLPATVDRVIFTEPDPGMRRQLTAKLDTARTDGTFAPAAAEVRADRSDALAADDASCDAVVSTLVLCTVPDPAAALAEIRRVLRPDGRLVFLEHVAAEQRPDRLRWQERLDPIWRRLAGGCRLARRTRAEIEAAGFEIVDLVEESARKTFPLMRATIRGHAVPTP